MSLAVLPGGPPVGVDLGSNGAVVTNYGAGTVSYSDTEAPFVAEGTIAATATATLAGTQFFTAPAGATIQVQPVPPSTGGIVLTPPTYVAVALGAGITAFGGAYATPGVAIDGLGTVRLRGLIQGSANNGDTLVTLPDAAMFPAARRVFALPDANTSSAVVLVTVNADGTVKTVGSLTTQLPALEAISFQALT